MGKRYHRANVLYFISGVIPTEAQAVNIEELLAGGKEVRQRNATMVTDGEALESFDEIAGVPPARYVEAAKAAEKTIHKVPVEPEAPAPEAGADGSEAASAATPAGKAAKPASDAGKGAAPGWKPNA